MHSITEHFICRTRCARLSRKVSNGITIAPDLIDLISMRAAKRGRGASREYNAPGPIDLISMRAAKRGRGARNSRLQPAGPDPKRTISERLRA
jgi:hypothetical protein